MRPFWFQWLTLVFIAVLAVSVSVALWRTSSVQHHQNDALRTIMCRAEAFVVADQKLTIEQKRTSLSFYNSSLESIHAKPCMLP